MFCVCVRVCEPSSLGVLRVCLFSQARLYSCSALTAIALSLSSLSHTHTLTLSLSLLFVCLSSSLLSLYPSILSHQGLLSGGPICRSSSANLIGDRLSLAWHGDELPNPFSPPARGSLCSALVQCRALTQRLQPQRRPRLRPRIQRSVCDDLRKKKKNQTHPTPAVLMGLNHAAATWCCSGRHNSFIRVRMRGIVASTAGTCALCTHRWVCTLKILGISVVRWVSSEFSESAESLI